jgi:tRNA-dihydrouridine synthase A
MLLAATAWWRDGPLPIPALKMTEDRRWRASVAPMMDWTDRHCRYFHRLLSRHALLYTEMVTTGALLHGDVPRHLDFSQEEHPIALQLGGSEPADLAASARLGERWGYDEINLNCGCPSERVQRGAFGACLMAEPQLVAVCVKAMVDAVALPVTVKHRIGIDKVESYAFVRDFVGTVAQAGCQVFIVHARNAWLQGLSPKQNREVPPLRYSVVRQLAADFPQLRFVLNGGLAGNQQALEQLESLQKEELPVGATHEKSAKNSLKSEPPLAGVMLGREAYHNPWILSEWDCLFFGESPAARTREEVEALMCDYMVQQQRSHGTPWHAVARHMLGLYHGQPGARHWRQVWSDHRLKTLPPHEVMRRAHARTPEKALA